LKDDRLGRKKREQGTSPKGTHGFHQLPGLNVEAGSNPRKIPYDFETVGIREVQRHLENLIGALVKIIDHHYLMLSQADVVNGNRVMRIYGEKFRENVFGHQIPVGTWLG
jgi:hypothetical protein